MARFELSTVELDVVWRAGALGDLPLILDVPSPGATRTERAELERRVWTELVRRDLADDHGHAHRQLVDTLGVIAHRRRSLQLRVFGRDATRAILASRGRHSVLATLTDRFHLSTVADVGLVSALLSRLPEVPPGPGHSVSVPTTAFADAAAAGTTGRAHDLLRAAGLGTDDARTLLAMTTGSVRTAQLVVERRDQDGRCVRSPVVSVHDTPAGRYRTVRTVTATGDHLTVVPTSTETLVELLTEASSQSPSGTPRSSR